jgi:hypothetical protein
MTDKPDMYESANGELDSPASGEPTLIYANAAGFRGAAFDCALDFGYALGSSEGEQPKPRWLVRVAMSWEHAGAVRDMLSDQIEKYEAQIGTPLPDLQKLKVPK